MTEPFDLHAAQQLHNRAMSARCVENVAFRGLKTRDGRRVRIFCRDGGGKYPVMGAYLKEGVWISARWTETGCGGNRALDLIELDPLRGLASEPQPEVA